VLRAALRASTPGERNAILWPKLGAISCWSDASAATPAAHLATLFPHARIHGKGLIATEAFISLPLVARMGSALAVRSHFLEFVQVNAENELSTRTPFLAYELQKGQRYAVVVSTGGGFYRYQLDDVVEVVGHVRECPLIRFIGRRGHVSDFFGEKLNDAYVTGVLRETLAACAVAPAFAMLACDDTLSPPAYVLYIETTAPADVLERIARSVESRLRATFHYDYARRLGQLGPLRVFRANRASDAYLDTAVGRGQRAGDVKPLALDLGTGWSRILQGHFIPASR
jgi:hypothetical protein